MDRRIEYALVCIQTYPMTIKLYTRVPVKLCAKGIYIMKLCAVDNSERRDWGGKWALVLTPLLLATICSMRLTHPLAILVASIALVLGVLFIVPSFFHTSSSPVFETSDSPAGFEFEIVDTPDTRALGLSGRSSLPENYGMLFVFDTPDRYGFWMKNMLVPIDIVWLSKDGTIIDITRGVSPDTYPNVFYPREAVSFVLETKAGESYRQGWEAGDRISLPY